MSHPFLVLKQRILTAAVALALPLSAGAQQAPTTPAGAPGAVSAPSGSGEVGAPRMAGHHGTHDGHGMHDRHGMHEGKGMRAGPGMRDEMREMGMGGGMRMLRGLNLTETQRDQVFELMHKQVPAMRERAKALSKSRQELQALAMSAQFDEARAKTLAEGIAASVSEMAMHRARTASAIYQLLTPEQRKQADEQRARAERRGGGPGPRMH